MHILMPNDLTIKKKKILTNKQTSKIIKQHYYIK